MSEPNTATVDRPRIAPVHPLCRRRDAAWHRLAMLPSLSGAQFALAGVLAAIFLATSFFPLNHTDLWGHLAHGRWIVEQGRLPAADPLRPGLPSMHVAPTAWLSQVLGYAVERTLGAEGLLTAHAALVLVASAAIVLAARRRSRSLGWGVTAAAVAFLLSAPLVGTIRPQLWGTVAFPTLLWLCGGRTLGRAAWVAVPTLFALWANLHGSFALGLTALGCLAWGETLEHVFSWRPARGPALGARWGLLLLAGAACLLNPTGPTLFLEVVRFGSHAPLADLSEWRAMTLASLSGGLCFVSLLATLLVVRFSPRRFAAAEVLLLLVFGTAALIGIRFLAWWAIVWPWVMAPHVRAIVRRLQRGAPAEENEAPAASPKYALLTLAVVYATLVWSPTTQAWLVGQPRSEAVLASVDTPVPLAREVARRGLEGRFFAPADWADYLVWHSAGRLVPVATSHVHLMTPGVWRDAQELGAGGGEWLRVVDHYGVRYLAVSRERNFRLYATALSHPRTRMIYQDQQAVLFEVLPPTSESSVDNATALGARNTPVDARDATFQERSAGGRAAVAPAAAGGAQMLTPTGKGRTFPWAGEISTYMVREVLRGEGDAARSRRTLRV